jgi:hypothetical protein
MTISRPNPRITMFMVKSGTATMMPPTIIEKIPLISRRLGFADLNENMSSFFNYEFKKQYM